MFFQELRQFIKSILSWVYIFLICVGLFFFFPLPENSFSVRFFKIMRQGLLPPSIQLIATNPLTAFLAQIKISLLLAFIFTFPIFLYQIINYFSPGLYEKEKKTVFKILLPSTLLFIAGCFFAYFLLIPLTFKMLYSFAPVMDVLPLFSVDEFISWVIGLTAVSGVMFLLPIFMAILSYLRIISPDFWKKNWRYAILFFLVVSAIITPDGTGITMIILSVPLSLLYFIGWGASLRISPKTGSQFLNV